MPIQILTHTPLYVWAILAFLVYRGVVAMREREVDARKLCIVPAVMLVLSLQDIWTKFGAAGPALAAWLLGAMGAALLAWQFGRKRIAAGAAPGSVLVRGSRVPLAMMMAVFCTKYAASVTLAIQPQVRTHALFAVGVCALFGVFNGCFLGGLARDLKAYRELRAQARAGGDAALAA